MIFFALFLTLYGCFCSDPHTLQNSLTAVFPCVPHRSVAENMVKKYLPSFTDRLRSVKGGRLFCLRLAALQFWPREYQVIPSLTKLKIYGAVNKDYSVPLETIMLCPRCVSPGTYFLEQSCISSKFRYNTNKDYFLILYFIKGGDGLWQERRIPMRRGRR